MSRMLDEGGNSRMWVPSHQTQRGGLHIGIDTKGGYQSGLESSVIFSLEDEVTLREEIIFNA